MPNFGFVYILTNACMPGLVKIGRTDHPDPTLRVDGLFNTSLPFAFDIEYAYRCADSREVEKALHLAFAPQRVNPRREFFSLEPDQPIAILELLNERSPGSACEATEEFQQQQEEGTSEVTQLDKSAADAYRNRRPNINFSELGIPIGAVLNSNIGDDGDITATVIENRKVIFRGSNMSLGHATKMLLCTNFNSSPTPYWTYNGRLLKDIYEEVYPR